MFASSKNSLVVSHMSLNSNRQHLLICGILLSFLRIIFELASLYNLIALHYLACNSC